MIYTHYIFKLLFKLNKEINNIQSKEGKNNNIKVILIAKILLR